ncbi:MAG: ADP-forming succinate--CoA ligase subunit beta [Magnetococcales bacterium]|nr:ADP-forming succinate--CoA ligase subunit beta [Magnetococcales bacterium]
MNIHEYQAKEILKKFGVTVPAGIIAKSGDEAVKAAETLGGDLWVVKAQVHAGGRGKAGGVKLAKSTDEVKSLTEGMLGKNLVTFQTDEHGQPVNVVYITAGVDIAKEYYLSILLDRSTSKLVLMASAEGGVEIEEVAEHSPEKIFKEQIDPTTGLMPYQARNVAFKLGLEGKQVGKAVKFMMALYKAYEKTDAAIVEINPMVLTEDDDIVCLDAKFNFDSNAMYRQAEVADMRDPSQEDEREVKASEFDLNYIALDGNIGCMVNGAGLAMATMDIIKHCGGSPANFLDVGGGATEEKVTEAFKLILSDSNVKGLLVNIFGGIMKCDVIANGVVAAAKQVELNVPLVVRLEGTNVEAGKEILKNSGLPIVPADDLADAADKIVAAVKQANAA